MALWQLRPCNHEQRNSFWLNVENSKAEALFATVRMHGLPVQIREINFKRDEVATVEGEFNAIPGAKYSIIFRDMFLQHISSTFIRVLINGKGATSTKMDKSIGRLASEPGPDREWTVGKWGDDTEFSFDLENPRGKIVVEYHSVQQMEGPDPEWARDQNHKRLAIYRDSAHPDIQFSYPPQRPYATFIFNFHPKEDIPRKYRDLEEGEEENESEAASSDNEDERRSKKKKKKSSKGKERATSSSPAPERDSGSDDYVDTASRNKSAKAKGKEKEKPAEDPSARKQRLRRGSKKSEESEDSEEVSSPTPKGKAGGKGKRRKNISKATVDSDDEEDSDEEMPAQEDD